MERVTLGSWSFLSLLKQHYLLNGTNSLLKSLLLLLNLQSFWKKYSLVKNYRQASVKFDTAKMFRNAYLRVQHRYVAVKDICHPNSNAFFYETAFLPGENYKGMLLVQKEQSRLTEPTNFWFIGPEEVSSVPQVSKKETSNRGRPYGAKKSSCFDWLTLPNINFFWLI